MTITSEARQRLVNDLRASADLIDKNGWIQGDFCAPQEGVPAEGCPMCSVGALLTATGGHPLPGRGEWAVIQRYIAAKAALADHIGENVIDWNDHPAQTAENVINTFRLVADQIESGEAFK